MPHNPRGEGDNCIFFSIRFPFFESEISFYKYVKILMLYSFRSKDISRTIHAASRFTIQQSEQQLIYQYLMKHSASRPININ